MVKVLKYNLDMKLLMGMEAVLIKVSSMKLVWGLAEVWV